MRFLLGFVGGGAVAAALMGGVFVLVRIADWAADRFGAATTMIGGAILLMAIFGGVCAIEDSDK